MSNEAQTRSVEGISHPVSQWRHFYNDIPGNFSFCFCSVNLLQKLNLILLCAGSSICHILWPVPSKAPSRADAVSLLAQSKATRSHQWIQGAAVHRSGSHNAPSAASAVLEPTNGLTYPPFFYFFHPPSLLPLFLGHFLKIIWTSLEPDPLPTHRVPQRHQ